MEVTDHLATNWDDAPNMASNVWINIPLHVCGEGAYGPSLVMSAIIWNLSQHVHGRVGGGLWPTRFASPNWSTPPPRKQRRAKWLREGPTAKVPHVTAWLHGGQEWLWLMTAMNDSRCINKIMYSPKRSNMFVSAAWPPGRHFFATCLD